MGVLPRLREYRRLPRLIREFSKIMLEGIIAGFAFSSKLEGIIGVGSFLKNLFFLRFVRNFFFEVLWISSDHFGDLGRWIFEFSLIDSL